MSESRQTRELSHFDLICQAAEAQDEALFQSARLHANLLVFSMEKDMRAVSYLAFQKKMAAVNFLLNRGAPRMMVALGLARAGEVELAYSSMEESFQDNPKLKGRAIYAVAYHIGYCLDTTKRDDFLGRIARNYPAFYCDALQGVAPSLLLSGNFTEMDAFLKKVVKTGNGHASNVILEEIACGLQHDGQDERMKDLLRKVKEEYVDCYCSALGGQASGYALQGKVEESLAAFAALANSLRVEAGIDCNRAFTKACVFIGLSGQCDRIEAFVEGARSLPGNAIGQLLPMIALALGNYGHIAQAAWFRQYVKSKYPNHLPQVLRCWIYGAAYFATSADIKQLVETIERDYPPILGQDSLALPAVMGLLDRQLAHGTPSDLRHGLGILIKEEWGISLADLLGIAVNFFVQKSTTAGEFHVFLDFVQNNHAFRLEETLRMMAIKLGEQGVQEKTDAFMKCVRSHYPRHVPRVLIALSKAEFEADRCTSQALVLRTLTLMEHGSARSILAGNLVHWVADEYAIGPVLKKANRLANGRRELSLSYNQLQAWLTVEIRCLLLLINRPDAVRPPDARLQGLPDDLLLNIARFLAPLTLSWRKLDDLAVKLSVAFNGLLHFGQPKGLAHQLLAAEEKPTASASFKNA